MPNKPATLILLCALSLPLPALASEDLFNIMFRMMLTMMNVMADAADDDGGGFSDWGMNDWDMGGNSSLGMGSLPMTGGMSGLSPWSGYGMLPGSGMGMSPWSSAMLPGSGMGMSPWSAAMPGGGWGNPFTAGSVPRMSPGGMNYPFPGTGYGPSAYDRGRGGAAPRGYPSTGQDTALLAGKWYGTTGEILEVQGNRFRLQAGKTAITGVIRIENNIVNLFSPQTGTVTRYTFVRNQTDLILQDGSGRLLSFSRRPLKRGGHLF